MKNLNNLIYVNLKFLIVNMKENLLFSFKIR